MRIHSVELTDFRGVGHCEIEFPDTGVTIIEGDNEVGKSSIDEAIRVVLTERDSANKAGIRALSPVGRDVGPKVSIELSTGVYRLRCTKQFLKGHYTELELFEPAPEQLCGREAHDRLRAILTDTMDETLWAALHMPQGSELSQAEFGSGALGDALDRAAGGDRGVESDSDGLWVRIVAERDKYFTATGRLRTELKAAEAAVCDAQAAVDELAAELRSAEADSERVGRLGIETADLTRRRQRNTKDLAELTEATRALERHRDEVALLRSDYERLCAQRDHAIDVEAARTRLIEERDAAQARIVELTASAQEVRSAQSAQSDASTAALAAVDDAREALRDAESQHRVALNDLDHLREREQLDELRGRRDRVADAIARRQEAWRVLETNRIDADVLSTLEDAHSAVVVAEAAAVASSATVTLEAVADTTVTIGGEPKQISGTETREITVSDSVDLEVPGAVRVTVRAGADAQQMVRRLVEARERLQELCDLHCVADLYTARKAAHERQEAARETAGLDRTIEAELRGLTPEEISARVDSLVESVRSYPIERTSSVPLPSNLSEAEQATSVLEARVEPARHTLRSAEQARDDAGNLLKSREIEIAKIQTNLELAIADRDAADTTLEAARADRHDVELTESVVQRTAAVAAGLVRLDDAQASFDADEAQAVEDRRSNAERLDKRLAGQVQDKREELVRLQATLAANGERGLAGLLGSAQSELERTVADRDRLFRRANAAKLLYDTFAARRDESRRRYVAPLRDSIHRLGRIVFGSTFEVEIDESLRIVSRTLDDSTVPYGSLSIGAKEQIGMIVRLAAAEIVATDPGDTDSGDTGPGDTAPSDTDPRDTAPGDTGTSSASRGAPVVFDDALGWSDPGRLEAMGAVLSTAARNTQVIVLTCTPGRYDSVGDATVVRLNRS